MSPNTNTKILITGANRGIGLGLFELYIAKANTTVIAAVRRPEHETVTALSSLPKGENSHLIVVKIDSVSETDAKAAIAALQNEHKITSLDIVIANAGGVDIFPKVADVQIADFQRHIELNAFGPLILFQAVLPLLKASKKAIFAPISSSAGSIGGMDLVPFPNGVYGPSKAMLNYLVRKIDQEHPDLTAFSISPGWVQTELGNAGAVVFGLEKASITVEESVTGVVKLIDGATREKTSGRFLNYTGEEFPW
ncbi:aflatoxin biosynthesis ketoreductase nor-1 [Phlyctema vagabunda]|uniref:Aflatoxin biosynthesis ketoreductase nor-1 n=1 Tax=Phlyctema vagabunda TaxID=108571 RepID=A0ABR4PEQ8_9HELO